MAADPNLLAGIASIAINGVSHMLRGDLAYSPGSISRETLTGQDGVHGYSQKPRAPSISGTFSDKGSLTVGALSDLTNVTISLELANGKRVVGRNMWLVGEPPDVKTMEGTFEMKFEGKSGSVTELN